MKSISLKDSGIFTSKEHVIEEESQQSSPQTVKKIKLKVVEKKKKERPSTELGDMKLKMLKLPKDNSYQTNQPDIARLKNQRQSV